MALYYTPTQQLLQEPYPHLDDQLLCRKLSEAARVLMKSSRTALGAHRRGSGV